MLRGDALSCTARVIVAFVIVGCGDTTSTGIQRNIDVGSGGDASVDGADSETNSGNGSGGSSGTGGRADSGGTVDTGGTIGAGGVRAGDAMVDSNETSCLPPPNLPPTGPACASLPYNDASESYTIWIADSSAPAGGHTITLATNQAVTVGGHTYKNAGAGLVGGGAHGIYGDAWFDVDGVANALGFHFEGCAAPASTDTWELVAAVTRSGPSCTSCPESITRRYSIRLTGSDASERYTFDAEGPPQSCGLGADLLKIVLY